MYTYIYVYIYIYMCIYVHKYVCIYMDIWGAQQLRTGCLSILMFLALLAEVTP